LFTTERVEDGRDDESQFQNKKQAISFQHGEFVVLIPSKLGTPGAYCTERKPIKAERLQSPDDQITPHTESMNPPQIDRTVPT